MSLAHRCPLPVIALVFVLAACGAGDDFVDDSATTTVAPNTDTTETSGVIDGTGVPETTSTTSTSLAPSEPVYALTGLPGEIDRPAVAIKIDNNTKARPQVGLNQADLLIEVIVESRLTRFIGVFHSTPADPVGPVRSARTTDIAVLAHLGTPLFANSGGNDYTLSAIAASPNLVSANVNAYPGEYFRDSTRPAPHNLFTNISNLLERAGDRGGVPPQVFTYLGPGQAPPAGATAETTVAVNYGNQRASYAWDATTSMWVRTQDGSAHVDAADEPVAAPNVVILETGYGTSPADPISPEAIVVGTGRAWVFTQGTVQEGTWSRSTGTDVATLTNAAGEPLLLTPGRTHLLLPRAGQVTIG